MVRGSAETAFLRTPEDPKTSCRPCQTRGIGPATASWTDKGAMLDCLRQLVRGNSGQLLNAIVKADSWACRNRSVQGASAALPEGHAMAEAGLASAVDLTDPFIASERAADGRAGLPDADWCRNIKVPSQAAGRVRKHSREDEALLSQLVTCFIMHAWFDTSLRHAERCRFPFQMQ